MKRLTAALGVTFTLISVQSGLLASAAPVIVNHIIISSVWVTGRVTLSPICPVERNPPDPACAPKPYRTTLQIRHLTSGALYRTVSTNALGTFALKLAPGSYLLQVKKGSNTSFYPRCTPVNFVVPPKKATHVEMSCDNGIR